jgi:hypothetical protein
MARAGPGGQNAHKIAGPLAGPLTPGEEGSLTAARGRPIPPVRLCDGSNGTDSQADSASSILVTRSMKAQVDAGPASC